METLETHIPDIHCLLCNKMMIVLKSEISCLRFSWLGVERLFRIIEKNLGILEVSAEEGENVPGKKKKQDEPQLINDKTHAHLREHQIDVFVCSVGDEMLW